MSLPRPPTSVKYFFGRISRDEAETELNQRGCSEGLYLLRESMTTAGNYALSICHQGRIHHYSIERQSDGTVMIQDGKRFKGPVELIAHHERQLDGFLTKPTIPCERKSEQVPMAWPYVTMLELERALIEKAESLNLQGPQLEKALGPHRQYYVSLVAKELHRDQPWFYGKVTRESADNLINNEGHVDGKFLVRERDDKSYALSLSYKHVTKHYKIEKHKTGSGPPQEKLAIEDGPRFDSLMDMIGHYHNKTDGLLCKLSMPCERPAWKRKTELDSDIRWDRNKTYGLLPAAPASPASPSSPKQHMFPSPGGAAGELDGPDRGSAASSFSSLDDASDVPNHQAPPPPVGAAAMAPRMKARALPPRKGIASIKTVTDTVWDDPDIPDEPPPPLLPRTRLSVPNVDDHQKIYDSVPRTEDVFNLNRKDLELYDKLAGAHHARNSRGEPSFSEGEDTQKIYDELPFNEDLFNLRRADLELYDKLGAGNFGSVMRGIYRHNGHRIPVAIKTLKQDDVPNAESEIMKEARVMAGLQHRNIVRLIGVCRVETIMLVMELAALGQLSKYLKNRKSDRDLQVKTVLELMFQVAEGMCYLESKNFVHRDLAARNVLLVNERFAKISDFGMSKALGYGNNYYQAETAGKWPLKWYAPECIYYFKFDSKSDVWSYGVTLWEALSFGAKPYKGLKGQHILELIDGGGRLDKPDKCPPGVYDIMLRCWTYEKRDRPTFKEIVDALRKYKT